MGDYLEKLIENSSEVDVVNSNNIHEVKWKSINEVDIDIKNYETELKRGRDKHNHKMQCLATRTLHKKNKHEKTIHLFDDLHKELKNNEIGYGFLTRSSAPQFAKALLPSMKIIRYQNNVPCFGENDEDDNTPF
jgi:hypothetical protein